MGAFTEFRKSLLPPWLLGPYGEAWCAAHGDLEDALVGLTKEAVKAPWPSYGPADALPLMGGDAQLEQGPGETEAAFRARLLAAFDAWAWAGTAKGLLQYALAPAGFVNAAVYTNKQLTTLGGAPPDGDTSKWARFWVVIGTPNGWTTDGIWSDSGTYDDGGTWGTSASPADVARVRRLIGQWKPAGSKCAGIIVTSGASVVIASFTASTFTMADAAANVVWDGI